MDEPVYKNLQTFISVLVHYLRVNSFLLKNCGLVPWSPCDGPWTAWSEWSAWSTWSAWLPAGIPSVCTLYRKLMNYLEFKAEF